MALRNQSKNSKKKSTNKKEEEKLEQVQDEFAEDQEDVEEGADELEEELAEDLSKPTEGPDLTEPQVNVSAAGDKEEQEKLEEAAGVEIVKPTPVKKEQQNVRVRPKRDFNTYIGNQWYNFKAGKVVTVPANVKDILLKANELSPL